VRRPYFFHSCYLIFVVVTLACFSPAIRAEEGSDSSTVKKNAAQTPTTAEKKQKAKRKTASENEKKSFKAKMEQTRTEADYGDTRFFRYKTNFLIGVSILNGSGLVMGGQLGYAPFRGTPAYFGPEVNFSLFSPGSILDFLVGGWYEFRVYGAPRLSINLGALGGPAFANSMPGLNSVNLAAFFDACIVQEVNDLVSVRGQFRPGYLAGNFAFMMNFNVSFRFL
jgi:hypothetical protein